MSIDYTRGVTGRPPIGKTITEHMIAEHPDETDEQIADRINYGFATPVITVGEVAHWRKETEQ